MDHKAGIVGVSVRAFDPIEDVRGSLCEIHRDDWKLAPRPVQWDYIVTERGALRGVHVHYKRWDYMIVLNGRATFGLKDLRRHQASFLQSMVIDVDAGRPVVVTVPSGVAHGVLARTPLFYLYGLSVTWDGSDENLGCRFDDPELGITWPEKPTIILPRDLELSDFARLVANYEAVAMQFAITEDATT